MHNFIYNLSKKPEKEILEVLKNKVYPFVGGYLIFYQSCLNFKISKIIHISKGTIIAKDVLSGKIDQIFAKDIGRGYISLFNFDFYKKISLEKHEYFLTRANVQTFSKELLKILETQYGKDYVEVENSGLNSKEVIGKIYFPEIEITDGVFTHKLLDVYVFLKFTNSIGEFPSSWTLEELYMFRTTVTYGEYKNNYFFSHFSKGPKDSFCLSPGRFCFGKTQLSTVVNLLKNGTSLYRSIKEFILLFDSYIRWESVDGGPYQYLNEIKEFDISMRESQFTLKLLNEFKKTLYSSLSTIDYSISGDISDPIVTIKTSTILDVKKILKHFLKERRELENYLGVEDEGVFGIPILPTKGQIEKANSLFRKRHSNFFNTFKDRKLVEDYEVIKKEDDISEKRDFDFSKQLIDQIIENLLVYPIKKKFTSSKKLNII